MKLVYTTEELSQALNMSIKKIALLRKYGAIKAIKRGKRYLFTNIEVNNFLLNYSDANLSNAATIKFEVLQRNKKGLPDRRPSKKESPIQNNRINNPIKLYQ